MASELLEYFKAVADYNEAVTQYNDYRATIQRYEHLTAQYFTDKAEYDKRASTAIAKYRALIPVTMIYEYLDTGRCVALEGHEGAYNIYESEIRTNMIISRLDMAVAKLDQITDNQKALHDAIQEGNREAQRITKAINSMTERITSSIDSAASAANACGELIKYNNKVSQDILRMQEYQYYKM